MVFQNHCCIFGISSYILVLSSDGKRTCCKGGFSVLGLLFLICLLASTAGAVVGFGGGVIMKPIIDLLGLLSVETASFLCGCTVLAMSVSSLIRTRNNGVALNFRISTPLAVGAIAGGLLGKQVFELLLRHFVDSGGLGAVQSVILLVINILVFRYILCKNRINTKQYKKISISLTAGILLGAISAFLGIGGGPYNIAVLSFLFSMDTKTAAKNSIYIIMFSQVSSVLMAILSHTVPTFHWTMAAVMAAGGVGGAFAGAGLSKRMDNAKVDVLLRGMLIVIIGINIYNVLKFVI